VKIEWTKPALLDLESIRDYIRRDSSYYATRFVDRIITAIDNLEHFPQAGRLIEEATDDNIRELLFHNYRIVYRAEAERVLILTIIHGARVDMGKPKPWDIV